MPQVMEKVVKPEKVILEDGRKGYFINVPMKLGAVLVVKYPTPSRVKKRVVSKTAAKKARVSHSHVSKSVIKALKEVKSRKATGDYPTKDFDALMDEL